MDLAILFVAVLLSAPPAAPRLGLDLDRGAPRAADYDLDSTYLRDQVTVAMALPYKYGVTQMPCKARDLQPERGWVPAREPSGRIQWLLSETTSVRWAGIYGTCLIRSPVPRQELSPLERTALECECNGWLPKGIEEYPLP